MNCHHADTLKYYSRHAARIASEVDSNMDRFYEPFLSLLAPTSHILDAVGTAGRDGKRLIEKGYRVTTIDACPEMVTEARKKGLTAQVVQFEHITWWREFDGIRASLLHISHHHIPTVISRLVYALKENGILYLSAMEGKGEGIAPDGRLFSYHSKEALPKYISNNKGIKILKTWTEPSATPNKPHWINILAQRGCRTAADSRSGVPALTTAADWF